MPRRGVCESNAADALNAIVDVVFGGVAMATLFYLRIVLRFAATPVLLECTWAMRDCPLMRRWRVMSPGYAQVM